MHRGYARASGGLSLVLLWWKWYQKARSCSTLLIGCWMPREHVTLSLTDANIFFTSEHLTYKDVSQAHADSAPPRSNIETVAVSILG